MPPVCRPKAAYKFLQYEFSEDGSEIKWENIRIIHTERYGYHLQFKNLPCGTLIPYGGKTISFQAGKTMIKNPNRQPAEYLLLKDAENFLDGNPTFQEYRYCWPGVYINELDQDSRSSDELINCQFVFLKRNLYPDMPIYPGIDYSQEYLCFVEIMSNISQIRSNRDKWINAFICYDDCVKRSRAEIRRRGYIPCEFIPSNLAPGWKDHWKAVSTGSEDQVLRERRDMLAIEAELSRSKQQPSTRVPTKKRPPPPDNTGKKYKLGRKKYNTNKAHPESL